MAITLIAHSWGTLPARLVAIEHPELVSRLVLFGPVVTRGSIVQSPVNGLPSWWLMTAAEQRPRQRKGMPDHLPTPISEKELDRWCAAFLKSDPGAHTRQPASNKIPNGPILDLQREWSGESLVDNAKISQPTMIIRGEWDDVTTDSDAARLFSELSQVQDKRDIKISGGNHWLHLQPRRSALWAETLMFLSEPGLDFAMSRRHG
jgi:pimeloyl-ACP methyl ester carboxylesterase